MQLKRLRVLLHIACFTSLALLSGCYSSQQLIQPTASNAVSRDPRFINDITFTGRSKAVNVPPAKRHAPVEEQEPAPTVSIQERFSSLLSVLPNSVANMSIYNFISDWYGVRYRLGGDNKAGIDCSAFVQKFYNEVFGMRLLRTAFEQFNTSNIVFDNHELKEGDLVFFKVHSRRISHVGIYLMNNFFVHASSSQGVVISSLNDRYWQKYYSCAGRVL